MVNKKENKETGEQSVKQAVQRETWTGKFDFFLTALGYAVGLGAIWRKKILLVLRISPQVVFIYTRASFYFRISVFVLQKWWWSFSYSVLHLLVHNWHSNGVP